MDDEPDFALLVQGNLQKEGFDVDVATSAFIATPDAVVLDVMMPEMDGYEVCSAMKKDDRLCDIAILMLTAVADHVTSTRYSHFDGMSMEADDYLPKPASAEQITNSVRNLLGA